MGKAELQELAGVSETTLLASKVGAKIDTKYGVCPATLYCVERISSPMTFVRFKVLVYGVQIAEVSMELRSDGSLVCEEL